MTNFIIFFIATFLLIGVPIGILAIINALRKELPDCTGSHDCVVYKGEKIQCPSCELREYQAANTHEK